MIQSTVGFTSPSNGSGSGLPGNDGDSAYQVAVNNGFIGTEQEWLDSLVGPAGADGADGADGAQGLKGDQGDPGPAGADGAQGPKGDKGDTGATGAGGANGLYGNFFDLLTQQFTNQQVQAGANQPIKIRNTAGALGISVVSDSRITFTQTGQYDLQFSIQLHNNGGGGNGTTVELWLRKNGTNVPDSNTRVSVITNSPYVVSAWDFIVDVTTVGDYYELVWATDNHNIYIAANTGNLGGPAIPSAIVTVIPVMHAEIGPTGATGATGPGVAAGGTTGQYLTKVNGADYNTQWSTLDLSGKQATITGGATTITTDNLAVNKALISTSGGKVGASTVTSTELAYLTNATDNIQSQLDGKISAVAPLNLTQSSSNANYPLTISSANEQGGGTGWVDIMKLINSKSGAINPAKHIRMNSNGGIEIVNNAYSSTIFLIGDNGDFSVSGRVNGSTIGDTGWQSVSSFSNGFGAATAVAYRKINNVVYMRGNLINGTFNTTAFTLPDGYRPSVDVVIPTQQYGTGNTTYVTVGTNGNVVPNASAAWLSSIIFPVG